MQNSIIEIEKQALKSIEKAIDSEQLEQFSIKYLGRKGVLTKYLRNISSLPEDERPIAGKNANILKTKLEKAIKAALSKLEAHDDRQFTGIDVTLPGRFAQRGSLHPITQVA
ncbi:MAG: phenylalanine--tRNA ligase subunit alpha, partial [Desulfobacula sp.]|nr:phenylalanine--tRNA ligase subunit alpha [Desulfobacula sp.]